MQTSLTSPLLNNFIKKTKICQNYMPITDFKNKEKVMLQISRYRRRTYIFWTWHNLVLKTLIKNADLLHITSLNIFIKTTKMSQKHLLLSDLKEEKKVMLQISGYRRTVQILWIWHILILSSKTLKKRTKHLCCKISRYWKRRQIFCTSPPLIFSSKLLQCSRNTYHYQI